MLILPQSKEWLDTYWHNIPTTSPPIKRGGKKGDTKKGDNPKSEDKDSNTGGTAGAHVVDATIPEESTAPKGKASIGAHISESNEQLSRPSRTVEKFLGAQPMSDDNFWGGTNYWQNE